MARKFHLGDTRSFYCGTKDHPGTRSPFNMAPKSIHTLQSLLSWHKVPLFRHQYHLSWQLLCFVEVSIKNNWKTYTQIILLIRINGKMAILVFGQYLFLWVSWSYKTKSQLTISLSIRSLLHVHTTTGELIMVCLSGSTSSSFLVSVTCGRRVYRIPQRKTAMMQSSGCHNYRLMETHALLRLYRWAVALIRLYLIQVKTIILPYQWFLEYI